MANKTTTTFSSNKGNNSPKKLKNQAKVFVIHRNHTNIQPKISYSSIRDTVNPTKEEKEGKEEIDLNDKDQIDQNKINHHVPKFNVKFQSTDIIFSNGNTREKRRGDLFQNYTSYTKYQLQNRDDLFLQQETQLKEKLALLNMPKNFHQFGTKPIPNYQQIDQTLYEADSDLLEYRDHELTRLKLMRRFDKNKVYSKYKTESFKIYKESAVAMDAHLEKLKQFFINQKEILINLDKDLINIGSSSAEAFYTGFEIKNHTNISTPTPTVMINEKKTMDKFIPCSIMETLTPITTEKEFLAVINENLEILNPNKHKLLQHSINGSSITGEPTTNISDTDAGETSNQEAAAATALVPQYTTTGRRRVGRPSNSTRLANNSNIQGSSVEPISSSTVATATNTTGSKTANTPGLIRMSRSDANNILNYNPEFAKQNPNYISNLINKHFNFPYDIVTEEMEKEISIFKKINEEEKANNPDGLSNRFYL